MNDYVGKICPFCKTAFQETDDIVVCSECDMPHHKDCWIENQGCTTFGCMGSIKAADGSATTVTASTLEYEDDIKPDQNIFCTRCGRKNDNTALFCSGCGARLVTGISQPEVKHTFTPADPNNTNPYRYTNPQYNGYQQQTAFNNSYVYSSTTTVDADVVQLIGTKSEYYYPKFQEMKAQNKKTSWNWCAFLVTPYWLIYRKMYGYGAAVLAVAFVIFLIGSAFLSLLTLAGYIVLGIFANYIYMTYLESKANQVKSMTEPYRSQFIAQNGGANSTATILTIIGYSVLILIISL